MYRETSIFSIMTKTSVISNPHFYYLLKGTLYRSAKNPTDLIEINQHFIDENPIVARSRVFEVYQNYIDVLLQSKGEVYHDHNQARNVLNDFIKNKPINFSKITATLNSFNAKFDSEIDFDKGLSIFLVNSKTKTYTTMEGQLIYEDKLLLHDLNSQIYGLKNSMHNALLAEYKLFQKFGYDCKDYIIRFPKTNTLEANDTNYILRTPINYTLLFRLKNLKYLKS